MQDDPIQKALENENPTDEEIQTLEEQLTPEQKQELAQKGDVAIKDTLAKLAAIRKEKNRVEALVAEANEKVTATNETMSQFRKEQIEKAKAKLKSDLQVSDDDMARIDEAFTRLDSGKVDAELIYNDLLGAYAVANRDSLLDAQRKRQEMQAAAAQADVEAAGTHNAPPPADAPKKYSEAAEKLAKDAGISPEAAERQLAQGMSRQLM